MATKTNRKNLGRGLSALIPDADMAFLSQIARGEPLSSSKTAAEKRPSSSKLSEKKSSTKLDELKKSDDDAQTMQDSITHNDTLPSQDHAPAEDSLSLLNKGGSDLEGFSEVRIDLVAVELIEANPYQPRRNFSPAELEELTDSVREHGLLQPIILRPLPIESKTDLTNDLSHASYQLVAGERRWRAAQAAGLSQVPAIVREVTDQQALELALIENVQRHDISALDSAIAYRRLAQEFSLSQEQVAQRVGKSRSAVANTIRLLDLPVEAQRSLEEGLLSEGHGRAILLAATDGARRAVLRRILRDKLSVRDAENLARQTLADEPAEKGSDELKGKVKTSTESRRIEESLQKYLGTRVRLQPRRQGGSLTIQFFSNEELDRILKLMMK